MKYSEKFPYGAWISKNAIIPVIDPMEHESVGVKILSEMFDVNILEKNRSVEIYRVLFRLGYVRLVYGVHDRYSSSVEYWKNGKHSKFQKDFIKEANWKEKKVLYDWEYKELPIQSENGV